MFVIFGNVQPNPGPDTYLKCSEMPAALKSMSGVAIIHINVQSLVPKKVPAIKIDIRLKGNIRKHWKHDDCVFSYPHANICGGLLPWGTGFGFWTVHVYVSMHRLSVNQ